MKEAAEFEETEVADVPVSPLLHEERRNKYGSVPGLEDEELAHPEELERQVMAQEWGLVLSLPVRGIREFRPDFVDNGGAEFSAFATVDFARTMPEFDKARYKADKLPEKLRDVLIMFDTVNRRLPTWNAQLADVDRGAVRMFEENRQPRGGYLLLSQTPEWEFLTAVDDAHGGTSIGPVENRSVPMPSGHSRS